jgi:2-iminobutanoate/2-iminopropanoate deaminase
MERERLNPPGVHTPHANYSHVARVGNVLYLSGQIPVDADGNLVGAGDAEAQAAQALKNIEAILRHYGATPAHVARIVTYITDLAYRPLVAKPRDAMFGTPGPASTLVVVKGLASPDYLVEIEATAVLD